MIREYETQDTDALIKIWESASALAHSFLPEEVTNKVRHDMRHMYLPNAETYVLEKDGKPIGFIAMVENEIGGLFLAPDQHGKGFGRKMVDYVVALRGPLTVEVFKENAVGLPFYERYGFVVTSEDVFELSGDVVFKMAMPGANISS